MFNGSLLCGLGAGCLWQFLLAFRFHSELLAQLILALPPSMGCCKDLMKDQALNYLM